MFEVILYFAIFTTLFAGSLVTFAATALALYVAKSYYDDYKSNRGMKISYLPISQRAHWEHKDV